MARTIRRSLPALAALSSLLLGATCAQAWTLCSPVGEVEMCYWAGGWATVVRIGDDLIAQRSDGSSAVMRRVSEVSAHSGSRDEGDGLPQSPEAVWIWESNDGEEALSCKSQGLSLSCA